MVKGIFSVSVALVFAIAMAATGIYAQDSGPKMINGGVLNGKATSLPMPEYPGDALAKNMGGVIGVKVTIDESGTVIAAEVESEAKQAPAADALGSGPDPAEESLYKAAESAAWQARFSPTLLNKVPVQVTGKIVYRFTAATGVVTSAVAPKSVSGGVLNGKATSLTQPEYPPAAAAVRAEGAVTVQITINENGEVVSASTVSGHPLLRAAAEAAARESKFSPTLLSGQPVKVTGVLIYNFTLPKPVEK